LPIVKFNRRHCLPFILVFAAMSIFSVVTSNAEASTTALLRPDIVKTAGTVTAIGAPTIWDALNDDVVETEVPAPADYVELPPSGPAVFEVGLSSVFVPPEATATGTAWFYMSTAVPVSLRVAAGPKVLAGPTEFSTPGWHSVPLPGSLSQSTINDLVFRISRSTGTKVAVVHSAFLRLSVNGTDPKVLWGSWIDSEIYEDPLLGNAPWDPNTWNLFENHARRHVSIVHFGQRPPWEQSFQSAPLEYSREGGAIPLMDMTTGCRIGKSCKGGETVEEEELNRVSLAEINAGVYDSYFQKWSEEVAAYRFPFFFRWAWEMNGPWFKWGRDAKSNPAAYIAAWRRIYNIAKAANASNITWVWCPNVDSSNSPIAGAPYPGDAFVDWTCMDGYNEGGSNWRSFSEVFGTTYNALLAIAPTKPIMVGEMASAEASFNVGPGEVGKRTWITDALATAIPTIYPKIKALVWFNWNILEGGTRKTWPIESSDGAKTAFSAGINSPYYAEDSFGNLPAMTKIQPLP
jgi:hypothetical protein